MRPAATKRPNVRAFACRGRTIGYAWWWLTGIGPGPGNRWERTEAHVLCRRCGVMRPIGDALHRRAVDRAISRARAVRIAVRLDLGAATSALRDVWELP